MKKTIKVVVPATCSVVPGSAWADELTFRKSGAVIPALIRSVAARYCGALGSRCRVRVGPEVRLRTGSVQFLVALHFEEDDADINLEALRKALEAEVAGVLAQKEAVGDHSDTSENAGNGFGDGKPSAAEIANMANERDVVRGVDAVINEALEGVSAARLPFPQLGIDQADEAALARRLINRPQVGEQEQSGQVLFPIELDSDDGPMREEVAETCEKVVAASLVGHGFPLALVRSTQGSKAFPAGRNLSGEMSGVHIKAGGLWILEKVTVTE